MAEKSVTKFRYTSGGALVCDLPVEGVTQELCAETATFYGGRYFVGESMTKSGAAKIASLLGGELEQEGKHEGD